MTIDELESELPNGLHDAHLRTFSSDPAARRAEFILDLWIGNLHSTVLAERECRRPARLELHGLAYLVIDVPDPRYPIEDGSPVRSIPAPRMTTRSGSGWSPKGDSRAVSSSPNGTRSFTSPPWKRI